MRHLRAEDKLELPPKVRPAAWRGQLFKMFPLAYKQLAGFIGVRQL